MMGLRESDGFHGPPLQTGDCHGKLIEKVALGEMAFGCARNRMLVEFTNAVVTRVSGWAIRWQGREPPCCKKFVGRSRGGVR